MKNEEIKEFVKIVNSTHNRLNDKLKNELSKIQEACKYSKEENIVIARRIHSCMKFFYPKQTKMSIGKIESKDGYSTNYDVQISKRGIGLRYQYNSNMTLIYTFVGYDKSDKNSIENILINDVLFNSLLKNLNDAGKTFFKELRTITKAHSLEDASGSWTKKINKEPILEKFYSGNNEWIMDISYDTRSVKAKISEKDNSSHYYHGGNEIYASNSNLRQLESEVFRLFYSEDIENGIKEIYKERIPILEDWKQFKNKFDNMVAKYAIVQMI